VKIFRSKISDYGFSPESLDLLDMTGMDDKKWHLLRNGGFPANAFFVVGYWMT